MHKASGSHDAPQRTGQACPVQKGLVLATMIDLFLETQGLLFALSWLLWVIVWGRVGGGPSFAVGRWGLVAQIAKLFASKPYLSGLPLKSLTCTEPTVFAGAPSNQFN